MVDATIAIPLFLILLGLTAFFNLAEMALEGSNASSCTSSASAPEARTPSPRERSAASSPKG